MVCGVGSESLLDSCKVAAGATRKDKSRILLMFKNIHSRRSVGEKYVGFIPQSTLWGISHPQSIEAESN